MLQNPPNGVASFDIYKRQHLSKIYNYTDENQHTVYFYFFRGKRSDYYPLKDLRFLSKKIEDLERELLTEYKKLINKS